MQVDSQDLKDILKVARVVLQATGMEELWKGKGAKPVDIRLEHMEKRAGLCKAS